MARTISKNTPKTSAGTLAPLTDPETFPPPSRLDGRKLTTQPFKPQARQPKEADGAALTRFGVKFREVFAREHGIDEADVDLGLIRQVEALNADDDKNMAALTVVQSKRTESGTLRQVRLVVNTPLLFPWLLNGRALRRMGKELRGGSTRLVTTAEDHPAVALPLMRVGNPESVVETVSAQRRLLGLSSYATAEADKKARIHSIVQFGVLDPPDVVMTQLVSDGGSAWVAQAAEGAQRLFSALCGMDAITNRSVSNIATDRWFTGGEPNLRDMAPEDLATLPDALEFGATGARGYVPGNDVATWLETIAVTSPAAVAFQLLRTVEVNMIIAVQPDPVVTAELEHPVSGTIQELIRSYHMPGKSKEQWKDPDVFGLIAIGAIDEMLSKSRITAEERSAWLGERPVAWSGAMVTEDELPGNRLAMAVKLLGIFTAQGAMPADENGPDGQKIVNTHLRLNSARAYPNVRADVAAAQVIAALALDGSGYEGSVQAALSATFRHAFFWKTSEHPGGVSWTTKLGTPIAKLIEEAQAERAAAEGSDNRDLAGPAQRALAALGGVALMTHPGLLAGGEAITRTGRGAGGKNADISASDPSMLLRAMAHSDRGLTQLGDAVVSLIASEQYTIPLDRVDDEPLTDRYLRELWLPLGKDEDPGEPVNVQTEFARLCKQLADALAERSMDADRLRTILPGAVMGLAEPAAGEERPADLWGEAVYEMQGVDEKVVEDVLPVLQSLVDFFQVGKAYSRAANRMAR
ncbi:hypothetical protein Q9R20_06265 [Microbacterium sp. PRF11]|uniref:hypothetical protein n=1 Tax=Microbacterium sp. PRF11 TaxID=2962593 RepID=UPI002882CE45|nr:hypothetical protein [Microbacterium sp. PRF11]MDT0116591.1 hypothetical protein [Microbacterium sp. PRF11]